MKSEQEKFEEWWAKTIGTDGKWTSLERIAAHDAWFARAALESKPVKDCDTCEYGQAKTCTHPDKHAICSDNNGLRLWQPIPKPESALESKPVKSCDSCSRVANYSEECAGCNSELSNWKPKPIPKPESTLESKPVFKHGEKCTTPDRKDDCHAYNAGECMNAIQCKPESAIDRLRDALARGKVAYDSEIQDAILELDHRLKEYGNE